MKTSKSNNEGAGPSRRPTNVLTHLWAASQLGWQVAAFLIVGVLIDRWAGTLPWATLILSMIGLVSSVSMLIRIGLRGLNEKSPPRSERR